MALATYNGGITVSSIGQIPVAYMVRADDNNIVLLNTRTPGEVQYACYASHPFTGGDRERNQRKQWRRVYVWGSGDITDGVLTVKADDRIINAYAFSAHSADTQEGRLWKQDLVPIIGRTLTVQIEVKGTSVEVAEIQVQYIPYG